MKRNILILEDKEPHMRALSEIISELPDVEILKAYSIAEAYYMLSLHNIHIFLVDIILDTEVAGDVSGLEFVEDIRKNHKYEFTPVIFITALEAPKLFSYSQLHCMDYIEKPFDAATVKAALLCAMKFPIKDGAERNIYFRKDGIIYSVKLGDIMYIENRKTTVVIHCVKDELEIPYKTIKKILEELDSPMFVQCSRYAVVNTNYIDNVDFTNRYVYLKGMEDPIEIGVVLRKRFKEILENG